MQARVAWRWPAAASRHRVLESLGGRPVYEAPVRVNGGAGRLAVFSFTGSMDEVLGGLRNALELETVGGRPGALAVATVRDDRQILRFILVRLVPPGQTIVFQLEQTAEEYAATQAAPRTGAIPELPDFPGASTTFTVVDEAAHAALSQGSAAASPVEVQEYYAAVLAARGWTSFLPGASDMTVYLNEQAILCVLTQPSPHAPHTQITLLHKAHGLK